MLDRTPARSATLLGAVALLLTGCAGAPQAAAPPEPAAQNFPVEITNCGHAVTVTSAPSRVVTLNQGATEVVLALGLADRLAGTAYLDDAVSATWREAYNSVPVLAAEYPTREAILTAAPDLVYASYASAFDKEVAGDRASLEDLSMTSYLSPFGCPEAGQRPDPTFDAVWDEVRDVAALFGEPAAADDVIGAQQTALTDVTESAAGSGLDVLWYDSGDKTPFVGGGTGGPQLIMDAVGATNIFTDIDRGWGDANWEDVVAADPDVIVLADASWSSAKEKRAYLASDPVLSQLTAVKKAAFVIVAYSETTPGVRMVDGAESVSKQLSALGLPE